MSPRFDKFPLVLIAALWLALPAAQLANVSAQRPSPSPTQAASSIPPSSNEAMNSATVIRNEQLPITVAYLILKDYLPAGTRVSSGFRDANDQIRVIRDYADLKGISVPGNMKAEDPSTWRNVVDELRRRNITIADPEKTPHKNLGRIVFDLAIAGKRNLPGINAGVRKAEALGLVSIVRTIEEHGNGAVHVELNITQKGCLELGGGWCPIPGKTEMEDVGNPQGVKDDIIKTLRQKMSASADLNEQINLLTKIQELSDVGAYGQLEAEKQQLILKLEQSRKENDKQASISSISNSSRDKDYATAEQQAQRLSEQYPDDEKIKNLILRLRAEAKYWEATGEVENSNWDCEACESALAKVKDDNEVSKLPGADRFKQNLARKISRCGRDKVLFWFLIISTSLLVLVGLFFAFRPGQLFLHCEDGDQHGESFALDQPEIIIGSLGEPDGEAQIVINDRKRKVSRSHCVVKQSGRRYYIKDLDSANGTSVNGRRLEKGEYHQLKKGDEILLAGAATLSVRRR